MKTPKKIARPWAAAVLLLATAAAAQNAPSDSVRTRLILKSFLDYGHIVSGTNEYPGSGVSRDIRMQPLSRANFLAIQEVATGNFDVAAGLAGLIWWPYGGGITDASERVMNVKPMIPVARARWRFGDPAANSGALLVGTFGHKYNPDAKNLGEYLYRSGAYPGYLFTTEGWLLMNRAGNYSHGAMLSLSHLGGALKQNFTLFMETNYYPIGDFSPGYDVSYTSKWFELGGGAVFHHYLALRPSVLEPDAPGNLYVHATVDTAPGQQADYYGPQAYVPFDVSDPTYSSETLHRWTHKGIKLMGRAALNLNHLLPPDRRSPEDLRIFAEVALLGVENQPLYYEDRLERMPVMFGINVPTFKLLDLLSVQGEYYGARFNDIDLYNSASLPVWEASFVTDDFGTVETDANGNIIPTSVHKDDWKWSVHARKALNPVMTVYAQAASDHLRLTDGKYKASNVPLTGSPSDWYYLFRLEFTLR